MGDFVSIASSGLTARINPLGAELWSLTDSAGNDYMTNADPAFWTGHAPLLFPIVGALNGGGYRLDGQDYRLAKHGFARGSQFALIDSGDGFATFRLTESAESLAAFPFAFALDMAFRLDGMALHMAATVSNRSETAMPFSFGFHPAFAWPLPGGAPKDAHRILFAADEPGPIRRLEPASGLLLPDGLPSPVDGRMLHPEAALFADDALIWDNLASRALSFGADGGSWLDISFADMPMLGIWQKPGAAYLCVEPWQGLGDPVGYTGDFRDKPGIVSLAPGASRSFMMDVTVRPG